MGVERNLDIVLYGASGVVGRRTAAYLARNHTGLRMGLAGRSAARLTAVRDSLGAVAQDWPILTVDHASPDVDDIASSTRVVVNTVGPYGNTGLPVVAACARAGSDYVDATGELPFVRASIDANHKHAAQTGARIVHSCGFDSVASDLTVFALHRRARAEGAGDLGATTFVLRSYSSGLSKGSATTMLELMRASTDARVRRLLDDPYGLSPDRRMEPVLGPQPDGLPRSGAEIAPELAGIWAGAYVMAPYNTRCVRRTNALLDWTYGRAFKYSELMATGSSRLGQMMATMSSAAMSAASQFGGAYLALLPKQMIDSMTPQAGIGMAQGVGHYHVETYTETTGGARYVATMSQQADPGYTATAMFLAESALALVRCRDELPRRFGVLTPAVAMGDALIERLVGCGVPIDVTVLPAAG